MLGRYDETPLEVPDSVQDTSKWSRATCPCCGQVAEMRWTGLRTVAATGDEGHADKQWRPPAFIPPDDGPFVVQEQIGLPGDQVVYSAVDPSTGITTGAYAMRCQPESDARALNAAYWLGVSHETHRAGAVVRAATDWFTYRRDGEHSEYSEGKLVLAVKNYYNGEDPS